MGVRLHSYFVSNYDQNFLLKINEQEFEDFKQYNNLLKKYTNVFDCYRNYKKSEVLIKEYIETIDEHDIQKLNDIYRDCKYLFMQNIMFGRILIDNIKSYCNQENRFSLKKEISNVETLDGIKMLKLLRDYGQHFSLPFSNLKTSYSFTQEKTTSIEPLISVSELRKNVSSNKQNRLYLKSLNEGEISIVDYFKNWSDIIDRLFLKVDCDFLQLTDSKIKQFIITKVLSCISIEGHIPVGLAKASKVDKMDFYHTVEFISFDEIVLVHLFAAK